MKLKLFLPAFVFIGFTCYSQSFISKEKALEDLDFYNKTLQEVHYNPFLYVEKETYFSEVENLKKSIRDSVELRDFMRSLYKISSLMQDSHSSPSIIQRKAFNDELKENQFFPLKMLIEENKLYVSESAFKKSGLPLGAEIKTINGKDINVLLKEVQGLLAGISEYKIEMSNRLLSHFLYLYDIKAPFVIDYQDPTGNRGQQTIEEGVSFINSLLVTMPGLVEGNSFKIIDNKIGYINFVDMQGDWRNFATFLDSTFTVFQNEKIKVVAIDLRENSGGNSLFGDILFGYLTNQKSRLGGKKLWKVSQQYKDLLISHSNSQNPYLTKKVGSIFELGDCEPMESRYSPDIHFDGEVYFLTGPFTFSSANMVADGAKQYGVGKIVGQPTGENVNDFGEVYSFELPNSKIAMNITTSFDIGAACDEVNNSPVMPDILITNGLQDQLLGRDKAMEHILGQESVSLRK